MHGPSTSDEIPQQRPDMPFGAPQGGSSRLNLMLGYARWRQDQVIEQLPRLLEPMGIRCLRASTGREATELVRSLQVHIAVVDLTIPMESETATRDEAGPRVLQLLRRLEQPPPTVVVRPPQPSLRESGRGLADALREGAFAVLDGPVRIEAMLEVLRRVVRRHFSDHWPAAQGRPADRQESENPS
jgi:DNA-binding response OmpR family regulator